MSDTDDAPAEPCRVAWSEGPGKQAHVCGETGPHETHKCRYCYMLDVAQREHVARQAERDMTQRYRQG